MPKTHLTDLSVKALAPPPTGQVDYWDKSLKGFGVRVSQGGAKTFLVMHGERRKRVKIGRYPIISLQKARAEAKLILTEASQHKGVVSIAFETALERFLATHCKKNKPSTAKATERLLRKHFEPRLGKKELGDIETSHIVSILDGLMETPGECNHAFSAVRTFFRWACRRQYLRHSPCASLQKPAKTVSRTRVLSHEELKKVWGTAETFGTYGAIMRLLILTGQRVGEITHLRGTYIDTKRQFITLPPELVKNNREHTFPYGAMAAEIIEQYRKGDKDLLFTTQSDDKVAFNNWATSKVRFDKDCRVTEWTLHDLRRTFSTNLAALGIPLQVVEKLLNHVSGSISGVAAIYNRHAYADEMQLAIQSWEKHITLILKH